MFNHFLKDREIESQQEQAAALAAMQKQMQLINNMNTLNYQQTETSKKLQHQNMSNNSSTTGSIRRPYSSDLPNNSSINANNSTRSLKRTSTGVSRR